MWSHDVDTPRSTCFFYKSLYEGIQKIIGIEVKVKSDKYLTQCVSVAQAMIHIYDNDTSGKKTGHEK